TITLPDKPMALTIACRIYTTSVDSTQVFVQTDEKSAHATWREVAGQLEKSAPSGTEMMDEVEADVLAYFGLPESAPGKNPLDQHAGAAEQRGETACGCGGASSPTKRASCGC
ncbi:hypothetical protein PTR77_25840, partial [Serratia bockelmannii]